MSQDQPNNPLHGVKVADMLTFLLETYGFDELYGRTNIRCFASNPGYKAALKFLRTTPWAKEKMEVLYLKTIQGKAKSYTPVKKQSAFKKKA